MKSYRTAVPLYLLFVFLSIQTHAQLNSLDKLNESLRLSEHDTSRSILLLDYAFDQYSISPDTVHKYTELGADLARASGFKKGIALTNRNYGVMYHFQSEIDSALFYFARFLELSNEINYQAGASRAYNNLGILHSLRGDYIQAISDYQKSLNISIELGDSASIARTSNNIGNTYREIGDFHRALEYLVECVELEKAMGVANEKSESLRNIGHILLELKEYQSAMKYFKRSLSIDSTYNRVLGVAQSYRDIGRTYQLFDEHEKALNYLQRSLAMLREFGYAVTTADVLLSIGDHHVKHQEYNEALKNFNEADEIFEEQGNTIGLVKARNKIADIHFLFKRYEKAKTIARKNLDLALSRGLKKEIVYATKVLYQICDLQGNYKEAYRLRSINAQYNDSIYGEFRNQMITTYENRYKLSEINRKNSILSHENEMNQAKLDNANLEIQKKNILLIGGFLVIILLLILTTYVIRYNKSRRKNFQLLRKKNREIIEINQELEERVRKRTKKIKSQNEKLQEYAFFNSHLVRAPLANILGYTQFLKEYKSRKNWEELNENIYKSANELDQVVRSIGEILDDDDLN